MAPRAQVPDTSVLVALSRDLDSWPEFPRLLATGTLWLSSVVVAELFAGTRSREDARQLHRLVTALARAGRIVTPTHEEWVIGGQLIEQHTRLRGATRPRDHLADVLILVSAHRLAATVVTLNVRHFMTWSRLARRSGIDVPITPFEPPPKLSV